MKTIYNILLAVIATLTTVSCTPPPCVDTAWNKEFGTASEIVETYTSIKKQVNDNKELQTKNLCYYVWNSGEYIFKCRGRNEDINLLPQHIEQLQLDDTIVGKFIEQRDTARFVDHYFMLDAMKHGETFDNSRDGLTITVYYPARAINHNDYHKLRQVFSCNSEMLHLAFMRKLKFPFQNSGCTPELLGIRPLIENNVKESKLKSEILALYDRYIHTMPGKPAPQPQFIDTKGKSYTFAHFRGKILVIDVWATWCHSCLAMMPKFMELRSKYSNNSNIEFITVSSDYAQAKEKWGTAIKKHGMTDMINLFPKYEEESTPNFHDEYNISGVPRYILIDKEGKIITAYAPGPGKGLEEIISNALNATN